MIQTAPVVISLYAVDGPHSVIFRSTGTLENDTSSGLRPVDSGGDFIQVQKNVAGLCCPFNSPTVVLTIYDPIFNALRVPMTHTRVVDDRFPNPRPYDIFEILTIEGILPIKILPRLTIVEHHVACINNTECALLSIYAILTDWHAIHSAETDQCRLTVKTKIEK